jgi:hypothetical protein
MSWKVESEFEHKGLNCVVIMTQMGHRCGYVGLPKEHPLYGKDYSQKSRYLKLNDLEGEEIGKRGIIPLVCMSMEDDKEYMSPDCYFDVHGGITYADGGVGSKYPIESDLWWFGYDCAHAGDANDLSAIENEKVREIEMQYPRYGVVRTLDYCIDECKSLAEQLNKISA